MYYLPKSFIKSAVLTSGMKRSASDAELDDEGQGSSKKAHMDSQDGQTYFNDIMPYEIKSLILECLPFPDLMTASLVCKEWKDHVSSSTKLTDKIIYKTAKKNDVNSPSEPFNRRYVNFDLHKLPTAQEFEAKFAPLRMFVSSIKLEVNVPFAQVKAFLDSFSNLRSLQLVHSKRQFDCFTSDADLVALDSLNLKHLSIRAKSTKFAAHAIAAVSLENKLQSFELDCSGWINHQENFQLAMTTNLKNLLNSQETLKSLRIFSGLNDNQIRMSRNDDTPFDPKFQLEELTIRRRLATFLRDPTPAEVADVSFVLGKLLETCTNTCKMLDIAIKNDYINVFGNSLMNMTKLEDLKFECDMSLLSNALLNTLLTSRVMQCRLKKLAVTGYKNRVSSLQTLLRLQKDTLEELEFGSIIVCESPVWGFVGKQMKELKVLKSRQLARSALDKFRNSSIEKMVITENYMYAYGLVEDEAYWAGFRLKNPSFQSVVLEY